MQDISFVASPGEVIALVGPSGGGKTSCANLIQHFYEPQSGIILLDGIPVKEFDHMYLHKKVSCSVTKHLNFYAIINIFKDYQ